MFVLCAPLDLLLAALVLGARVRRGTVAVDPAIWNGRQTLATDTALASLARGIGLALHRLLHTSKHTHVRAYAIHQARVRMSVCVGGVQRRV